MNANKVREILKKEGIHEENIDMYIEYVFSNETEVIGLTVEEVIGDYGEYILK